METNIPLALAFRKRGRRDESLRTQTAPDFPLLSESAEDRSFFKFPSVTVGTASNSHEALWVKRCFFPWKLFFFSFRAAATAFLLLQRQLAAEIPPMPNARENCYFTPWRARRGRTRIFRDAWK